MSTDSTVGLPRDPHKPTAHPCHCGGERGSSNAKVVKFFSLFVFIVVVLLFVVYCLLYIVLYDCYCHCGGERGSSNAKVSLSGRLSRICIFILFNATLISFWLTGLVWSILSKFLSSDLQQNVGAATWPDRERPITKFTARIWFDSNFKLNIFFRIK